MTADLGRTPRSVLVHERSSFLDERNRVSSQVEQLRFNYKVPPLACYLSQPVCPSGGVCGLSHGTRIDEDNCVALMPNGRLSLSLDKDSFEMLGVEGKPSRFNHRTNCRFVVSIDLTDSSMAPGGRGYQRLHTGLRSRLQLKTDFLLSHHPGDASLQALLSRYDWSERRPEISSRTLTDLSCPDLQSCDSHSLLDTSHVVTSFLSTLVCPERKKTVSRALSVSVRGLLLPQDIHRLIQEIRLQLESWASLTVHGFVDSPVSWGDNEHGVMRGGENFYSLLMFHDHTYQLYLATGAQDSCPP
uniref:Uncharacterized protein n=1 Tax=Mola mola TaxID=94237 RepID=A0A3Q3XK43_MOLML